jgi:two-component sensor histidine kinase
MIQSLPSASPQYVSNHLTTDNRSDGADWSLSVKDNGIGMPTGTRKAKAGLGTGIIEALATHLGSSIKVIASNPGVAVTISHHKEMNRRREATAA